MQSNREGAASATLIQEIYEYDETTGRKKKKAAQRLKVHVLSSRFVKATYNHVNSNFCPKYTLLAFGSL